MTVDENLNENTDKEPTNAQKFVDPSYKPWNEYYNECKRKHETGESEIIDRETYLKRMAEQKAKENGVTMLPKPKMTKK